MARIKSGATCDAHMSRPTEGQHTVNPPTEAGSTILFPDCKTFLDRQTSYYYGRHGTPTHRALEDNLARLESANCVILTPSGLMAITLAILSVASSGGHVLITDSAYDPTRHFCDHFLKRFGLETTYYDPLIGDKIRELIRSDTKAILCESPGSQTFEIQDIPAIINAAGDVPVIVDNTWTAGVYFKPLDHGAAISLQAITKYVGGHSDLLMGAVCTRDPDLAKAVKMTSTLLGNSVSAQDVTLAHRGLRTLHRRLETHEQNAIKVAQWLEAHPAISSVLHPALPSHPQYLLWKRDFTGSSGLFSMITQWTDKDTTMKFIDALELFGLGYSWGGFESLCIPATPHRTATPWAHEGQLFRFHIGLEDSQDLIADLEAALAHACPS